MRLVNYCSSLSYEDSLSKWNSDEFDKLNWIHSSFLLGIMFGLGWWGCGGCPARRMLILVTKCSRLNEILYHLERVNLFSERIQDFGHFISFFLFSLAAVTVGTLFQQLAINIQVKRPNSLASKVGSKHCAHWMYDILGQYLTCNLIVLTRYCLDWVLTPHKKGC